MKIEEVQSTIKNQRIATHTHIKGLGLEVTSSFTSNPSSPLCTFFDLLVENRVNLFLFGVLICGFLSFGVKICIKLISFAGSTQPHFVSVYCFDLLGVFFWVNLLLFGVWVMVFFFFFF